MIIGSPFTTIAPGAELAPVVPAGELSGEVLRRVVPCAVSHGAGVGLVATSVSFFAWDMIMQIRRDLQKRIES